MTILNQKQIKKLLRLNNSENKLFTLLCRALLQSNIAALTKNKIDVDTLRLELVQNTWNLLKLDEF